MLFGKWTTTWRDVTDQGGAVYWFFIPAEVLHLPPLLAMLGAATDERRNAAALRSAVGSLPVTTFLQGVPSRVAKRLLKGMLMKVTSSSFLTGAFGWSHLSLAATQESLLAGVAFMAKLMA